MIWITLLIYWINGKINNIIDLETDFISYRPQQDDSLMLSFGDLKKRVSDECGPIYKHRLYIYAVSSKLLFYWCLYILYNQTYNHESIFDLTFWWKNWS